MAIVEISDLSFSYNDGERVLDGLSFNVMEGEYLAIIGHNGSGKSTLAKIIAGINLKYQGEAKVFGLPIDEKNIASIRQKMGFVFQNPDNQFVGSTVRDDIAFGLENRAIPTSKMDEIIDGYAKKVGMYDFLDKAPENLSGGQKQRVAIAGVLALSPDLLIYDEATSMLDPAAKKGIIDLTFALKEENPRLTIISITHDIEEASKADRILVLNGGKIALFGTPKEVFSHTAELQAMRLDLPFYEKLVAAIKENGGEVPTNVTSLDTLEDYLCQ